MINKILCLVPEMKPPFFELFVELLVRKNSRVTRKPLLIDSKEKSEKNVRKSKWPQNILNRIFVWFSIRNLPDKEKCIHCIRCIAQNLKTKRFFSDNFAKLLRVDQKHGSKCISK